MCTVTTLINANNLVITSTRDEQIDRPESTNPILSVINGVAVMFPRDTKAGGTWFAVNQNQEVLVLLNGADKKHEPNNQYIKSRGLIILDLISTAGILGTWQRINLNNIEPFTLVCYSNKRLYQLRWDAKNKSTVEVNMHSPQLWASSTLYSDEIVERRKVTFDKFSHQQFVSYNDILEFHAQTYHTKYWEKHLINKKEITTKSITQVVLTNNSAKLTHRSLVNGTEVEKELLFL